METCLNNHVHNFSQTLFLNCAKISIQWMMLAFHVSAPLGGFHFFSVSFAHSSGRKKWFILNYWLLILFAILCPQCSHILFCTKEQKKCWKSQIQLYGIYFGATIVMDATQGTSSKISFVFLNGNSNDTERKWRKKNVQADVADVMCFRMPNTRLISN